MFAYSCIHFTINTLSTYSKICTKIIVSLLYGGQISQIRDRTEWNLLRSCRTYYQYAIYGFLHHYARWCGDGVEVPSPESKHKALCECHRPGLRDSERAKRRYCNQSGHFKLGLIILDRQMCHIRLCHICDCRHEIIHSG